MSGTATYRAPKVMARMVHGDGDQKRTERRFTAKTPDGVGQSKKRVLEQILGRSFVSEESSSEGANVAVVRVVSFAQRRQLSPSKPRNETHFRQDLCSREGRSRVVPVSVHLDER